MIDEKKLLFTTFKFNEGVNLAIRRGVRPASIMSIGDTIWLQPRDTGAPRRATVTSIKVKRFRDIKEQELATEHDPQCRNYMTLFGTMRKLYDDFDEMEIVSMIYFTLTKDPFIKEDE